MAVRLLLMLAGLSVCWLVNEAAVCYGDHAVEAGEEAPWSSCFDEGRQDIFGTDVHRCNITNRPSLFTVSASNCSADFCTSFALKSSLFPGVMYASGCYQPDEEEIEISVCLPHLKNVTFDTYPGYLRYINDSMNTSSTDSTTDAGFTANPDNTSFPTLPEPVVFTPGFCFEVEFPVINTTSCLDIVGTGVAMDLEVEPGWAFINDISVPSIPLDDATADVFMLQCCDTDRCNNLTAAPPLKGTMRCHEGEGDMPHGEEEGSHYCDACWGYLKIEDGEQTLKRGCYEDLKLHEEDGRPGSSPPHHHHGLRNDTSGCTKPGEPHCEGGANRDPERCFACCNVGGNCHFNFTQSFFNRDYPESSGKAPFGASMVVLVVLAGFCKTCTYYIM